MQSDQLEKIEKLSPPKRGVTLAMEFLTLWDFSIFRSNSIGFVLHKAQ